MPGHEPKSESIETDWLVKWARFAPRSIAFQDSESGVTYSYGALLYLSCVLAEKLEARYGINRWDRVAILALNEIEYPPLFFAIQRLGAIMIPLNHRLAPSELATILNDGKPRLLIKQDQFLRLPPPERDQECEIWAFDGPGGVRDFINEALHAYEAGYATKIRQLPQAWFRKSASEHHDACMILYTSGTTGTPKGAIVTNKMLHWNSINTSLRLNINQDDVALGFSPLFHTSGWNVLLMPFVHRGAKTILMKKFVAARALEICEKEQVTILFGVPTTMDLMVQEERFVTADLSRVRYAVVGGEPLPLELIKTWQIKGVPIRQGYGLTEFGPGVFSLNQEDAIRKIGSIGFANFFVETRVVDHEGRDVAAHEVGELLLRGPACTPGYWNRPEATREAIVDGWFHTADLVKFDEEGYFFIVGRKKDMFISGGENVYPAEVEQALAAHPAIREAAIIGVPDARWGEVGKAFLVLHPGASINLEEINRFCAERLAKYKIPKSLTILNELPKGPSGKIQKLKLVSF